MTSIKRTPSCLATNARSPKLRNSLMPIARRQRNKRQKQRTKPWPCLGKLLPPKTVSTLLPTHPIWKFAPSAKARIRWLSNITTASTMIVNVWDLTEKPRWCPHLEPTPAVFARMREPNLSSTPSSKTRKVFSLPVMQFNWHVEEYSLAWPSPWVSTHLSSVE